MSGESDEAASWLDHVSGAGRLPERRTLVDLVASRPALEQLYAHYQTPKEVMVEEWAVGTRWSTTPPGERLRRRAATPTGRVLSVHGGGWALGAPRLDRAWTHRLALGGLDVFAAGYSLAPEAAFPTAVGECAQAIYATFHDAAEVVIAAYSAGANLAVAALLCLADAGWTPPQLRVHLAYGIYDLADLRTDPAGGTHLPDLWRTAYLGAASSPLQTHPYASPLRAANRLPPGAYCLQCGTDDALLDQTRALAAALDDSDECAVELHLVDGGVHGFLKAVDPTPAEREAQDAALRFCGAQT